jgi:cell shape-determining protein MreC
MKQFILNNLAALLTLTGGAIAWIIDRKKRNAELEKTRLENKKSKTDAFQNMQDVYEQFVNDVTAKIKIVQNENDELKKQIIDLKKDIEQIESLRKENADLKKQVEILSEKVTKYENELKMYRKENK